VGIDNYITDPKNHKNAHVFTHDDKDNSNGLVVATHPLKTFDNQVKFFINPSYGVDMNLGIVLSLVEVIYQENVEWTTSAIVGGTWDFVSGGDGTVVPNTGANCVDATGTVNNDVAQFDNGGDFDLSDYIVLSGWIALTLWDGLGTDKGISIYGWDTGSSTQVGDAVRIDDYVNTGIINTWQEFFIPLSDMNLSGETIDSIRVSTVDVGAGRPPAYFLDDMQFEGAGPGDVEPALFTVEPDLETWFYVHKLTVSIADNISGIVTVGGNTENATMIGLSYDQILGEAALTIGLNFQRITDGVIESTSIIRQLSDFLQFPNASISTAISDGTNTFVQITINLVSPVILKSETKDKLSLLVSDNLAGLLQLRVSALGSKELRS